MDFEENQRNQPPPEVNTEQIEEFESDNDNTDWSQLASSQATTSGGSGRKRKRVFKKFSPTRYKRKKSSPKKRKAGGGRGGASTSSSTSSRGGRARLASKLGKLNMIVKRKYFNYIFLRFINAAKVWLILALKSAVTC